jgi:formiminotetrahydrofolate cyclodeaminase
MATVEIDYFDVPVSEFLEKAGAAQPTPGGGSIAALTGSLAISMARMAGNYTIGRKKFADREAAVREALDQLARADDMFRQLMREDIAAYQAYSDASALPQDDPGRPQRMAEALALAITVPSEMVALAVAALEIMDRIKELVNPRLLSDLAVAATLMESAARAAALNVRVNLAELSDRNKAGAQRTTLDQQLRRAAEHLRNIDQYVESRF